MSTGKASIIGASLISFMIIMTGQVVFAHTLEDIKEAVQLHGRHWTAGHNSISLLPDHEKRLRVTLNKPVSTGSARVLTESAGPGASGSTGSSEPTPLLANLDWRANGCVSSVKDQGTCSSCWAFATAGALESYIMIHDDTENSNDDRAEEILISCSPAGSCRYGNIDEAATYIMNTGLPVESVFPYTVTASDDICGRARVGWAKATRKIPSWAYVTQAHPSAVAIKAALGTYGPLATTMAVYYDFYSYKSGVYEHTIGALQGYHAVLIVGYQDDPQISGGGYFIVKNSWGTGWGEKGFFNIAYSQLASTVAFGQFTIAYTEMPIPGDVTAVALTTASIQLTWTDASNYKDSFKVERCQGAGCTNFAVIWSTGIRPMTYTNTGLTKGVSYSYRVRGYNTNGQSAPSTVVTVVTPLTNPIPLAPTSLVAAPSTATYVLLSWTDNSWNETIFKIERCTGAGCTNFVQVGTVPGNTSFGYTYPCYSTGLQKNTVYVYRVRAYSADGDSAYSNSAQVQTPSK